ncbi:MAG TPA: sigma-54 dependent transcriptional regulator [Bacteroidales bacterium]|nr:sigma-54 dependent transcriptional regulator [Bacteroidales bacterium]HNS47002.1 sigma-54 dependent transcriptional regulator [Bacteroidales bacterium]
MSNEKTMQDEQVTIFVVEDNEWYNRLLVHHLDIDPGYVVKSFLNGKELLAHLHERPDIITLDYRLPDTKGSDLLRQIREFDDGIEVIIVSEQEDVQTAVDLLHEGAFDYLVKNEEIRQRLHNAIHKIEKSARLKKRISVLEQEVITKYDFEKVVVGNSPAMKKVLQLMGKAVANNITVTVTGETGTGKEVIAKAIHFHSPRRDKPFVAVNMSAVPSELFESEFFGFEKGSFTGATVRRIGKLEEAHGGTLFLDEIADTDINFQPKLLRALQEREISRIGSNEIIKFDCRIIVASNRNLQNEVKNGTLRRDLYYRLFGLQIDLPPLRERQNDVLILARHFMDAYCQENHLSGKLLSEEAKNRILSYPWPGNVRELKSVIELAIVMSSGDTLTASDIMLSHSDLMADILSDEMTLKEYEKTILKFYLSKYSDNIKLVAKKLGIGQATVYRMLKEM